jgi:hypothetical protein
MGDWSFDSPSKNWPNTSAMVAKLNGMGMQLMVSVWPFSAQNASSFGAIHDKYAVMARTGSGEEQMVQQSQTEAEMVVSAASAAVGATSAASAAAEANMTTESTAPLFWGDPNCGKVKGAIDSGANCYLYDASNPDARDFVWSKLSDGYLVREKAERALWTLYYLLLCTMQFAQTRARLTTVLLLLIWATIHLLIWATIHQAHGIRTFWLDASEPESAEPASQVGTDFGIFSEGRATEVCTVGCDGCERVRSALSV